MKLERWALIAEIVGAVAIVASLIFVGLEVRQSNKLASTTAYQQNIDSLIDLRMMIVSSGLSDVWVENLRSEDITSEARNELAVISQIALSIYDKAYVAYQNGIMDSTGWNRFDAGLCQLWLRGSGRRMGLGDNYLSTEFRSYAEEKCELE